MTRLEHLAWCKARALEYLDAGDLANAVTSMASDLNKHEETRSSYYALMSGGETNSLSVMTTALIQDDSAAVRRWIEGFD